MKKQIILAFLALPIFSCSIDAPVEENFESLNATVSGPPEEIEFQIRESNPSFYCNDQVEPTNDFEIVFQEPTEIPLTIAFYIKKDLNSHMGYLGANVSAVSVPVGTKVQTVYSSCDLPYLLKCEVNGTVSGSFYIGVTEVIGRTSNYNYFSNDIISIRATRSCYNLDGREDPNTIGW